jgi:hypothetical protein
MPTKAEYALKDENGIPSLKKSPVSGSGAVKINTGSLISVPKEISTGEPVFNSIDKNNLEAALLGDKSGKSASFQARTKLQTPYFKKTVEVIGGSTEKAYLDAHLGLAEIANHATKPVIIPEAYSANPKSVPPEIRDLTIKAMLVYNKTSWIKTVGSVAQKMQDPFMSGPQHDLEIYTTSAPDAVQYLDSIYKSAGYTDGVDYQINGSKIQFQVPDEVNGGMKWDTGIETFTHGKDASMEDLLTQANETKTNPLSSNSSELPYGYKVRSSLRVPVTTEASEDGTLDWLKVNKPKKIGELDIMDLREQLIRKVAGSTILQGGSGTLEPAHGGRIKDPLDVVTAGVTLANNGHVDAAGFTVQAVNADFAKFNNNPKFPDFAEKVAKDSVFDFVLKNQRVPTTEEYYNLTGEKIPVLGQIVSVGSGIAGRTVNTGNPLLDDFLNGKSSTIPTGIQAKLPDSGKLSGDNINSLAKKNLDVLGNKSDVDTNNLVSGGKQPNTTSGKTSKNKTISTTIDKQNILGGSTNKQSMLGTTDRDINGMISGLTNNSGTLNRTSSDKFSVDRYTSSTSSFIRGSETGSPSPLNPSSSSNLSSMISSSPSPLSTSDISSSASPVPKKSTSSPSPISTNNNSPSPVPKKSTSSPSPISTNNNSPSPVPKKNSPSPSPVTKNSPSPSPVPQKNSLSPSPVPQNSPSPSASIPIYIHSLIC